MLFSKRLLSRSKGSQWTRPKYRITKKGITTTIIKEASSTYVVHLVKILQLVGNENTGGGSQEAGDAVVEELATHVGVHGRQRIVQEEDVGAAIYCTCKVNTCPLTYYGKRTGFHRLCQADKNTTQ